MQVVEAHKCLPSIAEELELCVGGLAPRARVAFFRSKLEGRLRPDQYGFILDAVRDDPVNMITYIGRGFLL